MPFDPRVKKILIVDDEQGFVSLLAQTLRMDGYEVETAFDGQQGLDRLKTMKPDAIISDIVMPNIDGFEFFEQVKSDLLTKDIPFLFVTAYQDSEVLARARKIGIFGILRKPIDLDQIERRLRELLR
ncbi:MAG: response regulator [Bacteroidetes bacterium]|nr:MAG: response regulator [Bacteroidota bacterium]